MRDRVAAIRIEPLGAHPELIEVISRWHVPAFDPGGSLEEWIGYHREEARMGGIPCAWVAFDGAEPVGSVSLIAHNMDTRMDLTPWLAALYVRPEHQGRGFGRALVERCEVEAWATGADVLYLYTDTAQGLYEQLGWTAIGTEPYEGTTVTLMARRRR